MDLADSKKACYSRQHERFYNHNFSELGETSSLPNFEKSLYGFCFWTVVQILFLDCSSDP